MSESSDGEAFVVRIARHGWIQEPHEESPATPCREVLLKTFPRKDGGLENTRPLPRRDQGNSFSLSKHAAPLKRDRDFDMDAQVWTVITLLVEKVIGWPLVAIIAFFLFNPRCEPF